MNPQASKHRHRSLLSWVMLLMVASQLLYLYSGLANVGFLAAILVILVPIIGWRSLRWREAYLLTLCFVLFALAWFKGLAIAEFTREGLLRSSFLSSFILLMALLREGAVTSPAVGEVGTFLTRQPPGRRYLSVFTGSHFFAVLINLGVLSLLTPFIQRGVRASLPSGAPLDDIAQVRERRQLNATLRGFSWFLVWAPTAVTQAVMPTLMSGIDALRLMGLGFGLAVTMMLVGWIEDSVRWRGFRRQLQSEGRLPASSKAAFPAQALRSLSLVCLGLFGLPLIFIMLFHVTIVVGVMLAAPLIVALWVLAQNSAHLGGSYLQAAKDRLDEISFKEIPGFVREAVFVACAGFIGTLAAKLVSVDDLAAMLDIAAQPGWLFLWGITASVWVLGQVGLSPVTMAVFLGSLVAELPAMPVDMTLAALAIAAGTAVCTTGAPFSSGAVLLARATGHSTYTLTWRWNGPYVIFSLVVLAGIYFVLAGGWGSAS